MPIMQERNSEAWMLGGVDHLRFDDRNFPIDIYNTGSESFTSEVTLGLDTVRYNPAPEVYTLASSILSIHIPGYYLVNFRTTLTMTGGGAGQAIISLKQDPATGTFATVLATLSYVYLPPALNQSMQLTTPVLVTGAGIFRYIIVGIRASGAGNVNTISGSTALNVVRLYQNGSYAPEA